LSAPLALYFSILEVSALISSSNSVISFDDIKSPPVRQLVDDTYVQSNNS
jgi:hypothetical protein